MSPATSQPHPETYAWSARRWFTWLGLAFFAQIAMLWLFGERPAPRQPPATFATRVSMLDPGRPAGAGDPWMTLSDPAIVPLSGRHGYSGEAWMHFEPVPHTVADWEDRLQILAPDERQLGMALIAAIEEEPVPPLRIADTGLPAPVLDQLVVPALRPPEASWLERSESLHARPLLGGPALPSWTRAEILTNTVIRLAVQPDGTVLTASLLQSCGLAEADAHALGFSRAARFVPLPPADPTEPPAPTVFGYVTFHWHTVAPNETATTPQPNP